MEAALEPHAALNKTQRCLIGAYFLNEYSFEASALFNPSIVRHPDQTGAPERRLSIYLEPSRDWRRAYFIADVPVRHHRCGRQRSRRSDRASRIGPKSPTSTSRHNGDAVEVIFRPDEDLSERVIFPITDAQANGIEDARFVAIQRRRTNNLLRDLHGLQRQGDPLRVARNDGFPIVPDDSARADRRRATRAWRCFRGKSTAAMR